jgi:hypothetical protein
MVPFSYYQVQLNSRGMKKHSSTFEVWMQGVWRLKLGVFALSCLLYCNSGPGFLALLCASVLCGQSAFVSARGSKNLNFEGI